MLPRVPFPLLDGGAIAMYNLVKGLKSSGADLTILAYNTIKHFADPIPVEILELGKVHTCYIDNRVKPIGAFLNLFSSKSYNISRFKSESVEDKLRVLLTNNTFDIIHFDSLYTGIYLPSAKQLAPNTITVLRQHNIEYQIWDRIATGSSGLKKWYLNMLVKRLRNEEQQLIPQFDAIIPITSIDAKCFESVGAQNQYVCPVGVNLNQYDIKTVIDDNSVFHLGSLDWMPNLEGMKWFIDAVWPLVINSYPQAKFYIAGRNVPDWIKELDGQNNIVVDGEIPSAPKYLQSKQIMVVPLKSGSGMRVKIIEGFAAGKAIVSTRVGAEGINYTKGVNIEIEDDAKEFASSIVKLLIDKEKVSLLGENSKNLIRKEYSEEATAKGLINFYNSLLK